MASSSDEGEIVEGSLGDTKASSLPHPNGSGVDRQDRTRSRYSSPENDSASRYSNSSRRSRSPRGHKRPRDDKPHYSRRGDYDSRQTRPRYDEPPRGDHRRPHISYDDVDRPAPPRTSNQGNEWRNRDRDRYHDGDRDQYADRGTRNRSRSPQGSRRDHRGHESRLSKEVRFDQTANRPGERSGGLRYEDQGSRNGSSMSDRAAAEERSRPTNTNVKSRDDSVVEPEPQNDYEEPQPIDEDAEIERRRKRREELLAKSRSATPLLLHAVGAAADKARASSPASIQSATPQGTPFDGETPQTPRSDLASPHSPGFQGELSPGGIDLLDEKALMNTHQKSKGGDDDGPSAADYDPTIDMQEDERRDELRHGQVVVHGEPHIIQTTEQQSKEETSNKQQEKPPASDDDDDDGFDMFADDFDEEKYATKPSASGAVAGVNDAAAASGKGGILEGDDKDGYYKIRVGEVLDNRYQLQSTLGKGMFSGVVRAVDTNTKNLVAIKIMRNNDALRKGGYTEIAILQKLNDADPENKRHIVTFERSFDYRGHLCMAFENLSLNLREVLRKFGNNVGINMGATRTYAYQIFVALAHMRKCSIIHADLKPDNILVNENRNTLKICDLGTAIDRSDAATAHTEITPYLVSRFYRAPEIILGMPYDYGVDMWSIGCTLYELYTGKILFTGDSNNQMLKSIMEIRGRLTPKLFKRGQLSGAHFDDLGQFVSIERDRVLGKTAVRTLPMVKPTRDLRTRLLAASSGMNDTESRELNHFIDLLEHSLALNPEKRIKPMDALKHPFFTTKMGLPQR